MTDSELPKLFFYANELFCDGGDDAVLLVELFLEGVDFGLERLLSAIVVLEGRGTVLEELALPVIEDAGLKVVPGTHLGDRLLLQQVLSEDGDLLVSCELAVLSSGQ